MIAYFPTPYKDELAYSLFARYYMHSGYTTERDVIDELYVNKYYRADPLFFNKLKPEAVEVITKKMSMQTFIEKHTMFPYYARFLRKERRSKALQSMLEMDGQYRNLLPINTGISEQCLCYCPCCVKEDRKCNGETYWHRMHQVKGINICPTHQCLLKGCKEVPVGVKATRGLVPAEVVIPEEIEPEYVDNPYEIELAQYVEQVFKAQINYDADNIGGFLRGKIPSQYVSDTGLSVNVTEMYEEYANFYSWLPNKMNFEQFKKVLNVYRTDCFEVCQIALFIGIPVHTLVNFKVNEGDVLSDTYRRLAEKYNLEYEVIAEIGKIILKEYLGKTQSKRSSIQRKKWQDIDQEMLPQVKELIARVNRPGERPVKICVYYVCKQLRINPKDIDNMTLCKAEIEDHKESQEKYWARELLWAVEALEASNTPLCWRRIRELTNMRKVNVEASLAYLKDMTDDLTYEKIATLL